MFPIPCHCHGNEDKYQRYTRNMKNICCILPSLVVRLHCCNANGVQNYSYLKIYALRFTVLTILRKYIYEGIYFI